MSRKLPISPAIKNLTATSIRPDHITLLAVSPNQEDRRSLESILDAPGWTIQGALSIREATRLMLEQPSLIVCDKDLPDGTWRDVLRAAKALENPPPVVIAARSADRRLWAEVFNIGAFDILLKPFEKSEVTRVMSMAFRHLQASAAAA